MESFLLLFATGDVEGLLEYYTEDALWMLPNRWGAADKIAARYFYQVAFDSATFTENTVSIEELGISRDWAFVRYTAGRLMTPKDGSGSQRRCSGHLTLLRKEVEGQWRISRDIFNNSRCPLILLTVVEKSPCTQPKQGVEDVEDSGTTAALYAREIAPTEPDPEPSVYLPDMWDGLEKALGPKEKWRWHSLKRAARAHRLSTGEG